MLSTRTLLSIRALVALVAVLGVVSGAVYYGWFRPGSFAVNLYRMGPIVPDPACPGCAWGPDTSVLDIWLNYVSVEVHSAGHTNQTGWTTIFSSSGASGYQRLTNIPTEFYRPNLAPGDYDQIRFNVATAIVNLQEVGNVTYFIVGGGFTPPFNGGGGDRVSSGRVSSVWVTVEFLSSEIHSGNGYLTPKVFAFANLGAYGCRPNTCPSSGGQL